jgi:hypothetical protein
MRFAAEPFMGSDTCFWVRGGISKKFFWIWDTFWIDAGSWCLAKTVSSPSWFCKCLEVFYKTAKILSVKGSMNKVSNFVNHLQNETSQNQRGVTHQINHTVRIFIIIVRFPMRLLRLKSCNFNIFASKEMWYLNGITLIKVNVLYWSTFRLKKSLSSDFSLRIDVMD